MIVCAAVVGPANNPLFLASNLREPQAGGAAYHGAPEEDPIRFHYIVHCALDVVDERLGGGVTDASTKGDAYLGMLYPTEDFRVYGWVRLIGGQAARLPGFGLGEWANE
jgi:trafficking protein particle complex subunit 2